MLHERKLCCLSRGTSDDKDADGVGGDAHSMVARTDGEETTAWQPIVVRVTPARLPGSESLVRATNRYRLSQPFQVLTDCVPQCSAGSQSGAMMPSSAVQATRPETIVAVGPPRNVSPPNGEFLLFDCV